MLEISAVVSFLSNFGHLGIFLGIALGGEILLLGAGMLTSFGYLGFFEIILAATFGIVLVDSFWYFLGRTGREVVFLKKIGKRFIKKESFEKWEKRFTKHSFKTIFFIRLIYGFRAFVLMTAGASRIPYGKFFLFNFLGSLLWAAVFTIFGYFFGGSFAILKKTIENIYLFIPLIIIFFVIIIFLLYFLKRKLNFK